MNSNLFEKIETAEIILLCADFDSNFEFFTERLNFKIFSIFPADNPSVAVLFGYGLRVRLEKTNNKNESNKQIQINLNCNSIKEESYLTAPNGVKIKFIESNQALVLPEFESKFIINRFSEESDWIKGRADMRYRDLIPERLGGSIIASHIHIPKGGIIPDYVHFHKIYFQMIYCKKGWAKLVYEDQGEPFIFNAGDCVLQPPKIRHRVLESSDNLEVIEVSSPAEHETFAEHKITLPTGNFDKQRDFSGQTFIHHKAENAVWKASHNKAFRCRDTGIYHATNGLAQVEVIRSNSNQYTDLYQHTEEFLFIFILNGNATLQRIDKPHEYLKSGDSMVLPKNTKYAYTNCSDDLEMLAVSLSNKLSRLENGKQLI